MPEGDELTRWQCRVCGYIYDPALHEGVSFERLDEQWLCPGCGFGKEVFFRLPFRRRDGQQTT